MSDVDTERILGMELTRVDLNLTTRPAFWETPRNIKILLATVAILAGLVGCKIGSNSSPLVSVQMAPWPAPSVR